MQGHVCLGDYFPDDIEQRTGAHTGTDITPFLNTALAELRTSGRGRGVLWIPPGSWRFTGCDHTLLAGHRLIGAGSQASVLNYDKGDGVAFHFSSHGGFSGGGIEGVAIRLEEGQGLSTAYALRWMGNAVHQPDQTEARDLYITALGNSYWFRCLEINGTARLSPQGVRVTHLSNIQMFRAHTAGIYIASAVDLLAEQIGLYSCINSGFDVHITGAGPVNTNSVMVGFQNANLVGRIYGANSEGVSLHGRFGEIIGLPTARNWKIDGPRFGALVNGFGSGFRDETWAA
jgi:hypothetical protein